jgi:hypothetical protein
MKVRFFNIVWDTDDDQVDLPDDVTLDTDLEDNEDVQYRGADVLSDTYGWCVVTFNYEILDN